MMKLDKIENFNFFNIVNTRAILFCWRMIVWFWISKILGGKKQTLLCDSLQIKICWFVVSAAAWSCWRLPLTNPALSASRDFGFWCGNGPEGMGPGAPNAALQHLTISIFVHDFFCLNLTTCENQASLFIDLSFITHMLYQIFNKSITAI